MSPTVDDFWFMDGHVTVHLARAKNRAGISITEHLLPSGFGPPIHVHHDEDETFYVLDGDFRFRLGDDFKTAKAGDMLHLPRGIPHGFRVLSSNGGRCLVVSTGRFEDMLRAASRPASSRILPPQAEPSLEEQQRLAAVCAAHGIDLLGPPID